MMMHYPWKHGRRFNSYPEYIRREFGERVQKVTLNAGFTCPNRDGTRGTGGCTYCNNKAFNPSYCDPSKPISRQLQEGIDFHKFRYKGSNKYLAYFQAFSNTYSDLETLKNIYNQALDYPGVIGLVIGTRPDCVDTDKLAYLAGLSRKYYIVVEYGIESTHDKTLEKINRGHGFAESKFAIEETSGMGIKTGAHLIFGLPGESREEMLQQAETISKLPLHSIKFHQLQLAKNTIMEEDYKKAPGNFNFFALEEYLDFLVDFVERLNPAILIERIAGEIPPSINVGPRWGDIRYDGVIQLFEKKLEEKNTFQGKKFLLKTCGCR